MTSLSLTSGQTHRFDTGSLSWVMTEIRDALGSARTLVIDAVAQDEEARATSLRRATAQLHQAHGALQIIDVEGVPVLTGACEKLLGALTEGKTELSQAVAQCFYGACNAVVEYLEELLSGSVHQPVRLFPYYRDVCQATGNEAAHPSDLFFPDLTIQPQLSAVQNGGAVVDFVELRPRFERALLPFLRKSSEDAERQAVVPMAAIIAEVERAQRSPDARRFWWILRAFAEGVAMGQIRRDVYVKQIFGRINLQFRRLADGSNAAVERLARDALFCIATASNATARVAQVRNAYQLAGQVPDDYERRRYGQLDREKLAVARENLAQAKQLWNRLASGDQSAAPQFQQEMQALAQTSEHLGSPSLAKLLKELSGIARAAHGEPVDRVALEMAASLLFVDNALNHTSRLSESFSDRADALTAHLLSVVAGDQPRAPVQWLDDLSREVQQKETVAVLAAEMQSSLNQVEKLLEEFFTAPARRAALPVIDATLHQIEGALSILDQEEAQQAVRHVRQVISSFNGLAVEASPTPEQSQQVAGNIGALSFFLETLKKQPESARDRFRFDPETGVFQAMLLDTSRREAMEVVVDLLPEVRDDDADQPAGLTGVAEESAQPSTGPTTEPATGPTTAPTTGPTTETTHALEADALTPSAQGAEYVPVPALPTAESMLVAAETSAEMDAAVDAELLEIFLTEADEVMECVGSTLPALRHDPANAEHAVTLRRSFHTLKGSGRMVGLTAFGEAAWSIEQVLNRTLADGRQGHPALYSLIEMAAETFSAWVGELRETGASARTPDALIEAANRLLNAEQATAADGPAEQEQSAAVAEAVDPVQQMASEESIGLTVAEAEEAPMSDEDIKAFGLAPIPAHVPSPAAELIEIPASGATAAAAPQESAASAEASGASEQAEPTEIPAQDKPVVRKLPEIRIAFAMPMPAPQKFVDDNIKRIGGLEIGLPLYNIYIAETDQLVRLLSIDIGEWRHEPERTVNILAVHAAHSLSGSSATVGLRAVHEVAHGMEMVLQSLARKPVYLTEAEYDLLQVTTVRLEEMLAQFRSGVMPPTEPALIQSLERMRIAVASRDVAAPAIKPSGASGVASVPEQDDELSEASTTASAALIPTEAASAGITTIALTDAMHDDTVDQTIDSDAAEETDDGQTVSDELDADLLPIFIEESRDILPQIGGHLRAWQLTPSERSHPAALLRLLHTIKGSGRMAGASSFGQHMHDMESELERITAQASWPRDAIDDLMNRFDVAMQMFDRLQHPTRAGARVALAEVAAFAPTSEVGIPARRDSDRKQGEDGGLDANGMVERRAEVADATTMPLVRVRADALDRMVNQAGEVSIARSRAENEVDALRQSLSELTENVGRLRNQLREIEIQAESQMASHKSSLNEREFDPLEFDRFTRLQELTRMMAESVNDVASVQTTIARTIDNATGALANQARLTRDLQQELMQARMVRFGSLSDRLYRVARKAAKEIDKRINLDVIGGSVEVDRGVLEKMAGPFEHLLRNSIVHGIEPRAERLAAGKSEIGEIRVEVRQEGNEVVIRFSDDGRGLDLQRICDKAREAGLIADGAEPVEKELQELIFQPGLTTAAQVTELAGRGVGMDVVRSEAASLGGRVEVESDTGKGVRFTIRLPLTLAVTQVVLLSTGGRVYAVPSVLVEQVQQLKSIALASAYNEGSITWQGNVVPLHYLSALLGDGSSAPVAQQYSPVIILRSGNERVAMHVDEVIGNREVVIKNIGPQLSRLSGIAGATVLGSGEIVLILDPVPLAQRASANMGGVARADRVPAAKGAVAEIGVAALPTQPVQGLRKKNVVMVVDDSLTVRRVTQRLLAREGYHVVLAKDGVDALEQLQSVSPDILLLDIEMPRMDGFDLTRNVRGDERTRTVPIVMITSRTAAKHRNYAMELGVNEYLGKPYQEAELLGLVERLVKGAVAAN